MAIEPIDKLSPVMKDAYLFAQQHNGKLTRFPGGFWAQDGWKGRHAEQYFGSSTVEALVKRGLAMYSKYQQGCHGEFPVEMELID